MKVALAPKVPESSEKGSNTDSPSLPSLPPMPLPHNDHYERERRTWLLLVLTAVKQLEEDSDVWTGLLQSCNGHRCQIFFQSIWFIDSCRYVMRISTNITKMFLKKLTNPTFTVSICANLIWICGRKIEFVCKDNSLLQTVQLQLTI